MRITALHHVQLAMPAGEEEAAAGFYQGLLGIPQVPKPENLERRGGCWFESATVRIHLGVEDGFRPARKAHPALVTDDLASLRAHLLASDVPIDEGEPLPGFKRFYASDPFGNRLEFLAPDLPP